MYIYYIEIYLKLYSAKLNHRILLGNFLTLNTPKKIIPARLLVKWTCFIVFVVLHVPIYKGETPYVALVLVFVVTLALLILWEVIENTLFVEIGWKFENRRDGPLNIFTDILFGTLGAIGTWLICHYVFVKEKKIWGLLRVRIDLISRLVNIILCDRTLYRLTFYSFFIYLIRINNYLNAFVYIIRMN